MVRYWELEKLEAEEAKASKSVRIICKKCGAEGEHKTWECTILIVSPFHRPGITALLQLYLVLDLWRSR